MYQYHCLNPISQIGLDKFTENYQKTEAAEAADAILVRSASMHEMELPEN
ncbi:MAG: 3-phosphoglycerate dehydrogenase, partial [[Ruminococcus] gnavus]|nr:3-phosphoglycerate dehydrogenase [Mediterraneibacter gnavus]